MRVPKSLHSFVADEQIKPIIIEERHDLTASDVTKITPERFVIFKLVPPKGQVVVVKSIAPFVCRRTDIGDPALESFEYIPAIEANGFMNWQPLVNGTAPFIIKTNINNPETLAAPPSDASNRFQSPGLTSFSDDPQKDLFITKQHSFNILVRGEKEFSIQFRLVGSTGAGAMPNVYTVGGAGAGKRVDFAGAMIYGVTMPEQLYNKIANNWSMLQ